MTDTDSNTTNPQLSMELIKLPIGFTTLASLVTVLLQQDGKAVLYVDDRGVIHVVPPDEVTFVRPPVLVVDPQHIEDYTPDKKIVAAKEGCTLLQTSVIALAAQE